MHTKAHTLLPLLHVYTHWCTHAGEHPRTLKHEASCTHMQACCGPWQEGNLESEQESWRASVNFLLLLRPVGQSRA
jgi:hypothetical protein